MTWTTERIAEEIRRIADEDVAMLAEKQRAYGNAALDPVRIFSRADAVEQLKVRIDDKLSRLARGAAAGEDVQRDLRGYLLLLEVATRMGREEAESSSPCDGCGVMTPDEVLWGSGDGPYYCCECEEERGGEGEGEPDPNGDDVDNLSPKCSQTTGETATKEGEGDEVEPAPVCDGCGAETGQTTGLFHPTDRDLQRNPKLRRATLYCDKCLRSGK